MFINLSTGNIPKLRNYKYTSSQIVVSNNHFPLKENRAFFFRGGGNNWLRSQTGHAWEEPRTSYFTRKQGDYQRLLGFCLNNKGNNGNFPCHTELKCNKSCREFSSSSMLTSTHSWWYLWEKVVYHVWKMLSNKLSLLLINKGKIIIQHALLLYRMYHRLNE